MSFCVLLKTNSGIKFTNLQFIFCHCFSLPNAITTNTRKKELFKSRKLNLAHDLRNSRL